VFENAADGTTVSGSLGDLVKAVKAGADVQVRYIRSASVPGIRQVEWHRTSLSSTVAEAATGGTSIVSCLFVDIPDTQLAGGVGRQFIQPFATEWQVFNTTGARQTVKFNHQTSTVISNDSDNLGIAWYVRCYQKPNWWDQVFTRFSGVIPSRG
jgi:hypothetical protein